MRKIFVLSLLGLCVSLIGGCCNNSTPPEPPPTNSGTYLTWDSGPIEIYVTRQPIQGVNDYRWIEPGTGEYSSSGYYFSDMGILIPYATKWSNGSYTLSTAPYEGVNYLSYSEGDNNIEFNDTSFVSNGRNYEAGGTEPDYWEIGTAPAGRTESDYAYDSNTGKYVYNGGSSSSNNAPQQSAPSTPVEQVLEELSSVLSDDDPDDEDVNGNVNENDGNTLRP